MDIRHCACSTPHFYDVVSTSELSASMSESSSISDTRGTDAGMRGLALVVATFKLCAVRIYGMCNTCLKLKRRRTPGLA